MQPRRQGELKIYDLTCSEIDWEEAGRITMHGYTLNGKSFPATDPVVAKLGQTVRIRFMNEGMMIHPMHRGMLGMVTALVVQPAIG